MSGVQNLIHRIYDEYINKTNQRLLPNRVFPLIKDKHILFPEFLYFVSVDLFDL